MSVEITLSPVKSSQIAAIGHDPMSKTLAVQFVRNPEVVYHYSGVGIEDFNAFKGAESIGSHFGKHIRNAFSHTKITKGKS